MTENKQESKVNLPLIAVGLIVAAGAGIVVGWSARGGSEPEKPSPLPPVVSVGDAGGQAQPATEPAAAAKRPAEAAGKKSEGQPPAGAPGLEGPCADYAAQLCAEAGEASETCRSARKMGELMPPAACEAAAADIATALAKIAEARKSCEELENRLCAEIGEETESCKMVRRETPNFPPDRCQAMLENYAQVLAQLRQMEEANKPLTPEKQAKLVEGNPPAFGPPGARVTVVEFSDFECPHCKGAAETVQRLKRRYGEVVRFVFRQYPLPFHSNADLAAQASLAAHAQGKFWEFHDLVFANQAQMQRANLEGYAQQIGLNVDAFRSALDAGTYAEAVATDKKIAEEVAVSGTPTMFVGATRVPNPRDYTMVSERIDEALRAAGIPVPPEPQAETPPAPQ